MGVSGRCLWIEIVKMVSGKGHGRIVLCPLLWLTKVDPPAIDMCPPVYGQSGEPADGACAESAEQEIPTFRI